MGSEACGPCSGAQRSGKSRQLAQSMKMKEEKVWLIKKNVSFSQRIQLQQKSLKSLNKGQKHVQPHRHSQAHVMGLVTSRRTDLGFRSSPLWILRVSRRSTFVGLYPPPLAPTSLDFSASCVSICAPQTQMGVHFRIDTCAPQAEMKGSGRASPHRPAGCRGRGQSLSSSPGELGRCF